MTGFQAAVQTFPAAMFQRIQVGFSLYWAPIRSPRHERRPAHELVLAPDDYRTVLKQIHSVWEHSARKQDFNIMRRPRHARPMNRIAYEGHEFLLNSIAEAARIMLSAGLLWSPTGFLR